MTDTSLKRTPRVGPCLSLLSLSDSLYKTDISLRPTLSAGPKGVRLKVSRLGSAQRYNLIKRSVLEVQSTLS